MQRYELHGTDAIGNRARVGNDVMAFVGHNNYFKVIDHQRGFIMLVTPKGSYRLNYDNKTKTFTGTCRDHKVSVSLKKIKGELTYQ
jgi:hypothetical protein